MIKRTTQPLQTETHR